MYAKWMKMSQDVEEFKKLVSAGQDLCHCTALLICKSHISPFSGEKTLFTKS